MTEAARALASRSQGTSLPRRPHPYTPQGPSLCRQSHCCRSLLAALPRAGPGRCCVSRIRAGPAGLCLLEGVSPRGGEMPSVPGAAGAGGAVGPKLSLPRRWPDRGTRVGCGVALVCWWVWGWVGRPCAWGGAWHTLFRKQGRVSTGVGGSGRPGGAARRGRIQGWCGPLGELAPGVVQGGVLWCVCLPSSLCTNSPSAAYP